MAVTFYMDVHIPRAITLGLRLNGVNVLTAQEDDAATLSDHDLPDRAWLLGRALFTFDDDLLIEASIRQRGGILFGGVVYAKLLGISIGECIRDLEIIAKALEPEDLVNRVEYIPL